MIIHGNKQISGIIYARKASDGGGAVALTNIIRGPQVVFGLLEPFVRNWLTDATKAAILAAFGEKDGKAVIKATNAYLNQLAASDRDKAQALAGFINEDPMMVCSLGLEVEGVTMPKRWIVGDGASYIDSNISLSADGVISEVDVIYTAVNTDAVFGADPANSKDYYVVMGWNNSYFVARGGSYEMSKRIEAGVEKIIRIEFLNSMVKAFIDSDAYGSSSKSTLNTNKFYIFARNDSGTPMYVSHHKIASLKFMAADETPNYWFVPYIVGTNGLAADKVSTGVAQAAGAKGMLDIVNCIFYPNAGSGSFTIPDISYTPSTP